MTRTDPEALLPPAPNKTNATKHFQTNYVVVEVLFVVANFGSTLDSLVVSRPARQSKSVCPIIHNHRTVALSFLNCNIALDDDDDDDDDDYCYYYYYYYYSPPAQSQQALDIVVKAK